MLANAAMRKAASELADRPRGRVLVGMSGGVDSAVTAAVLKAEGFDVVGATMRLYDNVAPGSKTCCSVSDILDARAICAQLGIQHETLDLRMEFKRAVIEPFISAYEQALTPNPCVECNRKLKFGLLFDYALELGCTYLATGHYARVGRRGGAWRLLRAEDFAKDQSYVLHPAPPEHIAHLLLPLGVLNKAEVRALADEFGLMVAHKGESQDICFVPNNDYAGFLEEQHGGAYEAGPVVDSLGNKLGEHGGLPRYTIGQRKGLGVATGKRMYVVAKDPARNTVVLGDANDLRTTNFAVGGLTWHQDPHALREAEACVRYHGRARTVQLELRGPEVLAHTVSEPFPSVAPGQACVFYQGDLLLGGGTILRS